MAANVPEALLILCGSRILHPEQVQFFDFLAEPGCFVGGQAVVDVVEQMHVEPEAFADLLQVAGAKARYCSVDHDCSTGSEVAAGS